MDFVTLTVKIKIKLKLKYCKRIYFSNSNGYLRILKILLSVGNNKLVKLVYTKLIVTNK